MADIIFPGGAKDGGDSDIPKKIMEYFYGIRKGTITQFKANHPYQGEEELSAVDEYISKVYGDADEMDFSKVESEQLRIFRICEYFGGGLATVRKLKDRQLVCAAYPDEFFKLTVICDEMHGITGYTFGLGKYALVHMNKEGV